jgi:hypothetical protein
LSATQSRSKTLRVAALISRVFSFQRAGRGLNHIDRLPSSTFCVFFLRHFDGGADGDRTHDLRLAKPALSQLSYGPVERRPNSFLARG